MCEPISAGTLLAANLGLTAASTGLEIAGQHQAAKAQTAYQQQMVKAQNAETGLQLSQLRIQQAQSREADARELQKARLASRAARSTATVAAGEAGVAGNSVDALLQEYSANLGQFTEASTRQRQLQDAGYTEQVAAIQSGARYSALQINAPVTGANLGASLVRGASGALSAYAAYNPSAFRKTPAPRG